MGETNMRVPIGKIKNDEDKEKHEKILEIYLEEMGWLSKPENTKSNMLKKIKEDLDKLSPEEDRSQAQEKDLYYKNVKKNLLINDEYEPRLMDNIRAEVFMIEEYELRKKYPTLGKALIGWSKGEEEAKKLLGYIILRETGRVTMPERMDVNYQCLSELINQYDSSFVDINTKQIKEELEKSKNVALIPYDDRAVFKFAEEAANYLTCEVNNRVKESKAKKTNIYMQSHTTDNESSDNIKPKRIIMPHEQETMIGKEEK